MSDQSTPGPRPAAPPPAPPPEPGGAPPAAHLLPRTPPDDAPEGWRPEDALPDEAADEEC